MVALEAGNQSFRLTKRIMKKVKCDVVILNPSDLAMIYQSLKKTDKEDALKLARLIKRIPREELPEVPLPSAKEEKARRLVSEHGYWTKQKVMSQNRLHSIFTREGFTEITRNHLNGKKKRTECLERLRSSDSFDEASRLAEMIDMVRDRLKTVQQKMKEMLIEDKEFTRMVMSMPGVGEITAITLMVFVNFTKKFYVQLSVD